MDQQLAPLPTSHSDIIQKKAFAHFATLMSDGTPQVNPVWVDEKDGYLLINSAVGRVKDKNVRKNPNVALSITDPDNPYRMLAVRGRVVEYVTEGADAHIDSLAKKYMGLDKYPLRQPGEQRVIYKIAPESVSTMG
jgi:PPOX class probable F420-dependent enzyme